ncbi:DUF4153 domain-containing protein [Paenibacillus paeoniae]|uniref:DUF4173 domain-containing protein n=1 Tax=Paenibacillus paeoniae TaxID=2292705 RepID=A0A371P7G1_9BACL|nr:DUF4173 domain-containing protein [Paenibacillus paeoniae]REK71396.1 DUF4173 domain-containing protein [Paenibacillus paeoniae]
MRDPAPWQRRYNNMWLLSILLGVLGQYLFVGRPAGVSVPIFVTLFYLLFFYAMKGRMGGFDRWRGQSRMGWFLFAPIALLSITFVLFANDLFRTLNPIVLFILIVAQTMLLARGGSQPWHRPRFILEHIKQWLVTPFAHLTTPFHTMADWVNSRRDTSKARSVAGKVGFGLLLAAPLLFVVVLLLASADGIFMAWLNKLSSVFAGGSVRIGVNRFIFACCVAIYVFCYLWGLLFQKRKVPDSSSAELTPDGDPKLRPGVERDKFDPISAATVLVCVNVVYVLFAVIQFTYLFGAAEGLLPEGTAYAEYARRGFTELVIVALINIGILLVGLHFIGKGSALFERLRQAMLSILMGSTLVMLISAYSRLSLYEEVYGYTQMRLLVHGFMIFLGVLMAVAFVRIWYTRFSLAKIYIALAITSYVIMNFANIDARIAVNNSTRFEETGKIDMYYLNTLSADAAPALAKLWAKHPKYTQLEDILKRYEGEALERKHWQSWNLSYQRQLP